MGNLALRLPLAGSLLLVWLAGGCATSESQPQTDVIYHPDAGPDLPLRDLYPADPDLDPLSTCANVGATRCDPTNTKLQTCITDLEGNKVWGPATPCKGGLCQYGRCVDPCDNVPCNAPPNACYRSPGACWNGRCEYEPLEDGSPCTDGDPCTSEDQCSAGLCAGKRKICNTAPPNVCLSANVLTVYTLPGSCINGACTYGSAEIPCPFGCNSQKGTCNGDPCDSVSCSSPPGECYLATGLCAGGSCTYLYDDGKLCDDLDPCTSNDRCSGGTCAGFDVTCSTPPDNTCLNSTTLISYSKQGTCAGGQCSYTQSQVTCPHGCDTMAGVCAGDPCVGMTCESPPNSCYVSPGSCSGGQCSYAFDHGKPCNDNNLCTTGDTCVSGKCQGNPVICNTPPASTCKNTSTLIVYTAPGVCAGGGCSYASAEVSCSYGCDAVKGVCQGDPCSGVVCNSPPNSQCYSVPGVCSNGQCSYLAKTGSACNDNMPCTRNDVCDANGTCAGTSYSCNDGLVCTIDVCDGIGGCSHNVDSNSCLIYVGGVRTCYQGGELKADDGCEYCDPSFSRSIFRTATGTEIQLWNFDDGSAQGWTFNANSSTVKWQVQSYRASSGNHSIYYGNVATRTYQDGLVGAVSGHALSPAISLPTGKGKLCVQFRLYKDTENYLNSIDQLSLYVVPASPASESLVWRSGLQANAGETYNQFLTFAAELSAFAGQSVQLRFFFDSYDEYWNDYEGVYVDSIRVLTNCLP